MDSISQTSSWQTGVLAGVTEQGTPAAAACHPAARAAQPGAGLFAKTQGFYPRGTAVWHGDLQLKHTQRHDHHYVHLPSHFTTAPVQAARTSSTHGELDTLLKCTFILPIGYELGLILKLILETRRRF